jgi:hypothetical protein
MELNQELNLSKESKGDKMETLIFFVIGVLTGFIFKVTKTKTRFVIYMVSMVVLVVIVHYFKLGD